MRCLITISSCYDFEKNGNNQVVRDTWLKDLPPEFDYRFVIGKGQGGEYAQNHHPDYLYVDVPDDYGHLTYKTRASHKWAVEQGYDFVFQCFPDTYVVPERLASCDFRNFDYYGDFRSEGNNDTETIALGQNYASGGAGYFLSRRACQIIMNEPILGIWDDRKMPYIEDMWVGNRLGNYYKTKMHCWNATLPGDPLEGPQKPLKYFDDSRFVNRGQECWPTDKNQIITSHLSCGGANRSYNLVMMLNAHETYIAPARLKKEREEKEKRLKKSKAWPIIKLGQEVGMQQVEEEILSLVEWLQKRPIKNVLEIGSYSGGTFRLWCELATGKKISVDKPEGGAPQWTKDAEKWAKDTHFIIGDSHNVNTFFKVCDALEDEKVDLLFIDGDHSYEGVKQDFEDYSKLLSPHGIVVFHDIKDSGTHRRSGCMVSQFWDEVLGDKVSIINGHIEWGGLGLIKPGPFFTNSSLLVNVGPR